MIAAEHQPKAINLLLEHPKIQVSMQDKMRYICQILKKPLDDVLCPKHRLKHHLKYSLISMEEESWCQELEKLLA